MTANVAPTAAIPAQLAKGALRRLALAKLEPTPDNYARAYAEEAGASAPPDARAVASAWAELIAKLVRGLERGGRQWTPARKKESLQRVLDGSRSDAQRLQQRLLGLVQAWEGDRAEAADDEAGAAAASAVAAAPPASPAAPVDADTTHGSAWQPAVASLDAAVRAALPPAEPRASELADRLAALADGIARDGIGAGRIAALAAACADAERYFAHRHHLVDALGALCRELGCGLTELAEDDSWARGQAEQLQSQLDDGVSVRGVRAASQMLADARSRQQRVRGERNAARDALKGLIQRMLGEMGELEAQTGRFGDSVGRHAEAIERAESLQSLAGIVREIVDESHAVRTLVGQARNRLEQEHARAAELEQRVRGLEGELRRLSDEVVTDALTQVANRRGLDQAFAAERARVERSDADAPPLAIALIDIDNFKKLNDTLGHAAGDQALQALAAAVRERLRPADTLARFGGEEFVVLLPATPADEAMAALTRLQRSLTEALFLHDQRQVLVTFSAGVTGWRRGETLQAALERADEALYEAKRTGKNRSCLA